jgi:hypothetical protein
MQDNAFANMFSGTLGVVQNAIGMAVGILVLVGALKMQRLQMYGLALTSSILAMIPCISPCCFLGLPFGIWAVVILNQDHVKRAFE